MLWALLLLSIGGLALGPVLVALGRGRATTTAAIDGLTLGVVPAIVVTRLLPHTMEALSAWALVLAAIGFALLSLSHRGGHGFEARVGRAVVLPTLFLHALADGAGLAIATHANTSGWVLGAALVLHRLPEGLFVATSLRPHRGESRRAWAPVALLAAGTVIGALGGHRLLDAVPDAIVDGAVAFGVGAMLRMVVHTHDRPPEPRERPVSAITFLVGLALVLALPDPESVLTRAQPRELSLVQSVVPLFVETAPAFGIGLFASALLRARVRAAPVAALAAGSGVVTALRGAFFDVPRFVAPSTVVTRAQRLFVAAAPPAAIVAFAIAGPELGIDSALLSLRLLGWPLTVARIAATITIALVVALLVSRVARAPETSSFASFASPEEHEDDRSGLLDDVGRVGAWYIVGIIAAATLEAAIDPALSARLPRPLDVVVTAVIAAPVHLFAQGGTPIAAVLIHKGFSTAAALALLLLGPALNLPIVLLIRRELGGRAAIAFVVAAFGAAVALSLLLDRWVPAASIPEVHPLVQHRHHIFEWTAAGVLLALLVASLLRLGPRRFLAAMAVEGDHHDHH